MWVFLKRYFGWYIWLGLYDRRRRVRRHGMLLRSDPAVLLFFRIFPVGVALAAPPVNAALRCRSVKLATLAAAPSFRLRLSA
jgi:hypothetical protein